MAGKKLTSDQKRAQRKRKEEKLARQRQHERNRFANSIEELVRTIVLAEQGVIDTEEIEATILRFGHAKSVSASLKESRFQSKAWDHVRTATTRLVSMTREVEFWDSDTALSGRVYSISTDNDSYETQYFPVEAAVASCWSFSEVYANTVGERAQQLHEGAYFFGLPLGLCAVHIALACSASSDAPDEIFIVTPKGWCAIDESIWTDALQPVLARSSLTSHRVMNESNGAAYAVELLLERQQKNEPVDGTSFLDKKSRAVLRAICASLVEEAEEFACASAAFRELGAITGYRDGIAKGEQATADECKKMHARLEQLRQENEALKKAQPSPKTSCGVCPLPQQAPVFEKALALRMAPLFNGAKKVSVEQ